MSLCDVCPQPKSARPCINCLEVRMEMNKSAVALEQKWDFRHKHVNGIQGDGELTLYPDMEINILSIDPEQVVKYGIYDGQILAGGLAVVAIED